MRGTRSRLDSELLALERVDLHLRSGGPAVIVGPSGSGKSTLLDLLAGLTSPSSGEIRLAGEPITGPGLDRGVVFQQYALLPWRTAQANVELGSAILLNAVSAVRTVEPLLIESARSPGSSTLPLCTKVVLPAALFTGVRLAGRTRPSCWWRRRRSAPSRARVA